MCVQVWTMLLTERYKASSLEENQPYPRHLASHAQYSAACPHVCNNVMLVMHTDSKQGAMTLVVC